MSGAGAPETDGEAMALHRYKSILFDLYGAFVRKLDGWVAVADLIELAEPLQLDSHAVRSSVSRFTRKGLLVREVRSGHVGYALSDRAVRILDEGDLRIFDRLEAARAEDGWVLAAFSVPERLRAERHQLRTRLVWLGFGNLGAGLWIAPGRILERAVATIGELALDPYVDVFHATYEAFGDAASLVHRCWDLDELQGVHEDFVRRFGPVERRWRTCSPELEPRDAFADYVTALHEWRKTPYLDPGLPVELLPSPWPGVEAAVLFAALQERLEPVAWRFVEDRVSSSAV